MYLPPKAFNPKDVEYIIHKYHPQKKTPGFDLITPRILHHLPPKGIIFLTYIFNSVLRTTYFPTSWKLAVILMIPKPKKHPDLPVCGVLIGALPLGRQLPPYYHVIVYYNLSSKNKYYCKEEFKNKKNPFYYHNFTNIDNKQHL